MSLIILTILIWLIVTADAFILRPTHTDARLSALCLAQSDDDYSEKEITDMKDLILSLSLEPTDDSRRSRLIDVFQEALERPNGMPKRFSNLFDKVLIQVGDQVQTEAKRKFFEKKANEVPEEAPPDGDGDEATREKTPDELQLWALVDMMVQSKTIVKQASGDLGSHGTFQ